jgi:PBP4 family serine-type D-alanyl-D-alanine carboxypeptidase
MKTMKRPVYIALMMCTLLIACVPAHPSAHAQTNSRLSKAIQAIADRPEYRHARFGMEVYSLDSHKTIYALNAQQLFVPGSTTKLLTEGTAMKLIGPDFRFKTKIYRIGPVDSDGTLKGDLVLVASGDPDLSGRLQPDGTLAFEDEDHDYAPGPGAKTVPGNPLAAIDDLATQVVAHGIRKIDGRVIVDISLFPEGERDGGTGITISPICVNDNVIDVMASPGDSLGVAPALKYSPVTRYARFINQAKTVASGGDFELRFHEATQPDGTQIVTVTGTVPLAMKESLTVYKLSTPSVFAETVLAEALTAKGVSITSPSVRKPVDVALLKPSYTEQNVLAVHTSAPLREEVKVTLKVSQNLHASMTMPYLVGTYGASPIGEAKADPSEAGFKAEHDMLQAAGLDLSGAMQSDGAGANAMFSPDFMVHYLTFISQQSFAKSFLTALPILGKDGTLVDVQKTSPAAGHVFAKTGTYGVPDLLNGDLLVTGKGLAGYIVTAKGEHLAFAAYANFVKTTLDAAGMQKVSNLLGEMAVAAYEDSDRP